MARAVHREKRMTPTSAAPAPHVAPVAVHPHFPKLLRAIFLAAIVVAAGLVAVRFATRPKVVPVQYVTARSTAARSRPR